jgi:hypothetical protein
MNVCRFRPENGGYNRRLLEGAELLFPDPFSGWRRHRTESLLGVSFQEVVPSRRRGDLRAWIGTLRMNANECES